MYHIIYFSTLRNFKKYNECFILFQSSIIIPSIVLSTDTSTILLHIPVGVIWILHTADSTYSVIAHNAVFNI